MCYVILAVLVTAFVIFLGVTAWLVRQIKVHAFDEMLETAVVSWRGMPKKLPVRRYKYSHSDGARWEDGVNDEVPYYVRWHLEMLRMKVRAENAEARRQAYLDQLEDADGE